MSWSRRALLTGALPLLAAGCFRPMLAEDSGTAELRGRIALPAVDGALGYHLVRRLEERLGRPADPEFRLTVAVATRDRGLAITQDNSVTRRRISATADWRLIRTGAAEPVLSGSEVTRSGYNATASLYATRTAARVAEERLAQDLAERISRSILARADSIAGAGGGA